MREPRLSNKFLKFIYKSRLTYILNLIWIYPCAMSYVVLNAVSEAIASFFSTFLEEFCAKFFWPQC